MIANGLLMNGADTLGMTLYDYGAAIHHWTQMNDPDGAETTPDVDEVEAGFMKMVRAGVAQVH